MLQSNEMDLDYPDVYRNMCGVRNHSRSNYRSNLRRVLYHLTDDPTLLGLGWGVIATWWVGVLLGVPLAAACRLGSWPKRDPRTLWRPLIRLTLISFAIAALAGTVGWIAASNGWVFLVGSLADRVPADRHVPFIVDIWAHSASYLVGFVGGLVLVVFVLLGRQRQQFQGSS